MSRRKKPTSQSREVQCFLLYLFTLIVGLIYFTFSVIFLFKGMIDANYVYDERCQGPQSRIIHVFPSYKLGCWLGEVP